MDELSLLRRIRADAPEPTASTLQHGRTALLERAAAETSPPAPPRRARHRARWFGLGAVGALGAGALVVTLVATDILGLAGWRGGADSAAAAVLDSAALATITNSDPELQPGQYLKVDTTAVYRRTSMPSDDVPWDEGSSVTYLTIARDQLYIPADRTGDWVWVRGVTEPYQTFDPLGAEVAQRDHDRMVAETGGQPELVRAPGGMFYGGSSRPDYADLPRNPQQLLNHIYRVTNGAGRSPDGEALVWIADLLRQGSVPADLRAALYQAAAGIPGIEITEQTANLDGRTGVAIGRVESVDATRQDIIIDPATGALIGEREVILDAALGLPAGTTRGFTAVTTSVVDSAPAAGTPNGRMDEQGCTQLGPGHFQC